ncbi:MAG: hypothetical protein Q8P48_09885 [Deltaproteobacteria bacterium]|nr:hypothetical protein [Deltaproteobacteria bacterium]
MGTDAVKYRRRKFLVRKGLQGRFVIGFSSAVLVGLLANLVLAYFLIDRELTEELYKIHLKIRTTSEVAVPILWKLGAVTIPSIIAISAIIGHFLTRRVEAPLQRFGAAVKKTGEGDFTQRLGGSAGAELSGPFNAALRSMEQRFRPLKKSGRDLEDGLRRLEDAIGKDSPSKAELVSALGPVREATARARRELSGFKV